MAGLFGNQGQQQQLQVVRRQLAPARRAAVVGKAETARTAAAPRPAWAAVPVMRREFRVLVLVLVLVMMVMMVVVMRMMMRHDGFLIS
jgi:hypothetical protein